MSFHVPRRGMHKLVPYCVDRPQAGRKSIAPELHAVLAYLTRNLMQLAKQKPFVQPKLMQLAQQSLVLATSSHVSQRRTASSVALRPRELTLGSDLSSPILCAETLQATTS
jgi:hypothetical protein